MAKVLTFSRSFPKGHPKEGHPTYFVEKILEGFNIAPIGVDAFQYFEQMNLTIDEDVIGKFVRTLQFGNNTEKHHTIRAGHRWKAGDWFSPRVWSGNPYASKQIQFAPEIRVMKVWDFEIKQENFYINNALFAQRGFANNMIRLAENDGLAVVDFLEWFKYHKPFTGQIICWDESINY